MILGWPVLLTACIASRPRLRDLADGDSVVVALDANVRYVQPGRRLKFYVDILNTTTRKLNLDDLSVELTVSPAGAPSKVALRKTWTYSWDRHPVLSPEKKITLPIVPETRNMAPGSRGPLATRSSRMLTVSELPIASLSPGKYEVRARVNDRFLSKPYQITVRRPDLRFGHAKHSSVKSH